MRTIIHGLPARLGWPVRGSIWGWDMASSGLSALAALLTAWEPGTHVCHVLSTVAGRLPASGQSSLRQNRYFFLGAPLVGFGFTGTVGLDGSGVVLGGFGVTPRRTAAVPGSLALIDLGGRDSVSRPRR
ncbi:MAG: hypothetical protein ACO1SX_06010, partial [Actinomycetota bacterium]